jgi:hypothetical protein
MLPVGAKQSALKILPCRWRWPIGIVALKNRKAFPGGAAVYGLKSVV